MAEAPRVICDSAALTEGGRGVRFNVQQYGAQASAFIIRYDGRVYAYFNSCAHIAVELDWMEGEFFDKAGLYLICIVGPCKGQHLISVPVAERDGKVYLLENKHG